jgi:hypothetical protein
VPNSGPEEGEIDAEETEDLSDLSGLLRSGRRGAVHESGCGSLGFEDERFQARFCQGNQRSRDCCRDDGKTRRGSKTSGRIEWRVQRACRAAEGPAHRERPLKPRPKTKESPARKVDDEAARDAALAFEREQKRRDIARRKEEAASEKRRKQREQAIAKAERALELATREHEAKAKKIEYQRAAFDRRSQAEDARWEKQKEKLEIALRRARD